MEMAPRLALWPGLCLTIVVYSLNMFGDAVRDLLDPRLPGGGGRLGADGAKSGLAVAAAQASRGTDCGDDGRLRRQALDCIAGRR